MLSCINELTNDNVQFDDYSILLSRASRWALSIHPVALSGYLSYMHTNAAVTCPCSNPDRRTTWP